MKKILKITSYVLLAGIFSVALSGCGKRETADPNANKLIVWSFEDEDAWKPIQKEVEKQSKGYKIVYQKQVLDSSYENKVLNSMLAGQGPDIWSMPNDWVYRHKEKLYPMPDEIAKEINLDNQFVGAIKQSVYFDGKIYAHSPSVEPLMVYYNPKLFSNTLNDITSTSKDKEFNNKANKLLNEPPALWSDFTETAKLLTKKNGNNIEVSGVSLGTSNVSHAQDILYLLMLQNQTKITSDDYKLATFNLPQDTAVNTDNPGLRAVDFYTSFSNPASPNYTWNDSLGNNIDAFANGKVAMVLGYSSLQNTLLQKYPDFRYKKAYAPQLQADSEKIVDLARFNAFGVSKLSKNPTVAWNAVELLVTDLSSDFNSYSRLYTSKKANNLDKTTLLDRNGNNPEKLELVTAKPVIKGRYPLEFDLSIREMINNINSKSQTTRSALDLTADKITELLRRDSW